MSNSKPNKITKKTLKRTDFDDNLNYEQFLRQQLSKQMTADLLEIAYLSNTPIPKTLADEKGIFRVLKKGVHGDIFAEFQNDKLVKFACPK